MYTKNNYSFVLAGIFLLAIGLIIRAQHISITNDSEAGNQVSMIAIHSSPEINQASICSDTFISDSSTTNMAIINFQVTETEEVKLLIKQALANPEVKKIIERVLKIQVLFDKLSETIAPAKKKCTAKRIEKLVNQWVNDILSNHFLDNLMQEKLENLLNSELQDKNRIFGLLTCEINILCHKESFGSLSQENKDQLIKFLPQAIINIVDKKITSQDRIISIVPGAVITSIFGLTTGWWVTPLFLSGMWYRFKTLKHNAKTLEKEVDFLKNSGKYSSIWLA